MEPTESCCHETNGHHKHKGKMLPVSMSTLAVLSLVASVIVSYAFPVLEAFRGSVLMYLKYIWWAVLLGFFLGGLLERYVPREYISQLLASKKKRTILSSVFLGFLMSACSHGILALSMELHKKGASTPVVVSFLLASPWANLPITLMLVGFFGAKALVIIFGALLVAFVTGVVFQFLEQKGLIEANPHTVMLETSYSIAADIQKRAKAHRFSAEGVVKDAKIVWHGALALADMTLGWVILGIILSSLAGAFIPPELFHKYMGPSTLGLFATLGLATLLEVCSEGTAPLAFEIFKQTGAFGNALVFLMAGVATDVTEIGIVWSNVGRKAALWIPAIAVPQIVLLGYLANKLFG